MFRLDPRWRRRVVFGLIGPSAVLAISACSSSDSPSPTAADPLAAVKWEPSFEPDYVNLAPIEGVEPATKEQQDLAVVADDHLEFPADGAAAVRDWQPGKIVVAAPGTAGAGNPLGYARRVVAVTEVDGKLVVTTEKLGLQDIVEGEFQLRGDNQGENVDLSRLDPAWIAENLYGNDTPVYFPEGIEPLKTDAPDEEDMSELLPTPGSGWSCCSIIKSAVKSAASAVKSAASSTVNVVTNAVAAVTPTSFEGSAGLTSDMNLPKVTVPLFTNMEFKKTIKKGKVGIESYIKGNAEVAASMKLNPGFQLGARIPNPINKNAPPMKTWMQIDSRVETHLGVKVNLEAGVSLVEVDGRKLAKGTKEFLEKVDNSVETAQAVYAANREELLGDKDMKPASTFTKVLWISSPRTQTFMAGPVPVVLTSTLQVNLVCGFEAKASLSANVQWDDVRTFKFRAEYESGKGASMPTPPTMNTATSKDVQVLGGGEIVLTCGVVPRVNAFVYDTLGIYAGIRGSLVAKAAYESKCEDNATSTTPQAEVKLSLDANVGVQVGGRIQVPGSSFAGKSGADLGFDSPPLEPYNKSFELYSKTWDFAKGIGYCTPLCKNGRVDAAGAKETDVDCGGGACGTCAEGKKCAKSSDCSGKATCNGGICRTDPCFDGVQSGGETGVDCGGSCTLKCAVDKGCQSGADCASGFCSQKTKLCVPTSCTDGIRDGNETGVDCGGSCGKCANGILCAVASDCASGFSNGTNCVATSCEDRVRSGSESGPDCGGTSSCNRCAVNLACSQNSDCAAGLQCTTGKCVVIPAPTCTDRLKNQNESDVDCGGSCGKCDAQKRCGVAGDCASSVCSGGTCKAPACNDGVKNGSESGVDCGGASSCGTCAAGRTCTASADCASGTCLAGVCAGTYTVGGALSGLASGGSIVLRNGGGDPLTVAANGSFTFSQSVAQSKVYAVTVGTQPAGQTCTVTAGSGTVATANVTNVTVACVANTYALGGNVDGLARGTIVLRNDGGNDVTVGNGAFSFPAKVAYRGKIAVTVVAQPAGQVCTVTGGTGTMGAGDIRNVAVTCVSNAYSVGGTVSGLKGAIGLANGADRITVDGNGAFTFPSARPYDSDYAASITSQPAGQSCAITGASGTVPAGNVTSIGVTCTDNAYAVGGNVTGLSGSVSLTLNGGNARTLSASGAFSFATPVGYTQPYVVAVSSQPANQTCTVANERGTMGAGDVTSVAVSCTTITRTLGGTVSGVGNGASVFLENNGDAATRIQVQNDGAFTFGSAVPQGSAYSVTVYAASVGKTCTVARGQGTVGAANVTDIGVTCTADAYSVGGTTTGLAGTVGLALNGGATLQVSSASYTFPSTLAYGASYAVTVASQPSGQTCTVTNGTGTVTGNVSNVGVSCATAGTQKIAFVTSATSVGSFSGVFGADARCQNAAQAAGIPGTYLAWIADTGSSSPASRFTKSTVPYKRVDGETIAGSWTELTTAPLRVPLNVTELGGTYNGAVWTSVVTSGEFGGSLTCTGWTKLGTKDYGYIGISSETGNAWTYAGTGQCSGQAALYCFQQ